MWGVFVSWMNVTANQLRMSGGGATPFENTKSLLFDGVDDNVNFGSASALAMTGSDFTASVWLKREAAGVGFVMGNDTSGGGWGVLYSNSNIRIYIGGSTYLSGSIIPLSSWVHFALTFNNSSKLATFYVDGSSVATNTMGAIVGTSTRDFTIGKGLSAFFPFNGNIDEPSVWSKELSLTEVQEIYNTDLPNNLSTHSASANLVSWWRNGDGDTYDVITDHGSAGIDGTMTNMTSSDIVNDTVNNPPFNTKSLLFDGIDDELILTSQFTLSGEFTISMWIKPTGAWSLQFVGGNTANTDFWRIYSSTRMDLKINGVQTSVNESSGNDLVASVWQHILVKRDSSNNISVYRNGVIFGSSFVDSNAWDFNRFATGWGYGGWNYEGNIDEIAYWNSEENVATIYNSGTPNDLTSLSPVGYWRVDGSTYPTITDIGSGGNDGTMTNMSISDIVSDTP